MPYVRETLATSLLMRPSTRTAAQYENIRTRDDLKQMVKLRSRQRNTATDEDIMA